MYRSKEENSAWKSIKGAFTKHQKDTVEQVKRKSMLLETAEGQQRPDMTGADAWLLQAVAFADGIIAEGEGDLADKGEFADVEFKVSFHSVGPLSRPKDVGR
jgi:kinetochore protein Mis13/DSN1